MGTDKETTDKATVEHETSEKAAENREDSIRRDYGFAADVELKECRYCRVMIPRKAKVCPNCRMSLKRHWFRNTVAVIFAVAVIGLGGYYLSEHWGIMRDAVMSVWMAQDSAAVSSVSVTTVDNAEMSDGVLSTWTSKVAVNTESSGNKDAEETVMSGSEAIQDSASATGKKEEDSVQTLAGTMADASEKGQSGETERKADDTDKPDKASAKETAGPDADVLEEDEAKAEKNPEDGAASGVAAGEESEDTLEAEDRTGTDSAGRNVSGQTAADDVDEEAEAALAEDLEGQEQAFRDSCMEVSYKALLRDTETYLDTALRMELQVVCQVLGGLFDENIYYLCKVEEVNGIERYYIIRDDREEDDTLILEGDTLIVYGQLFGNCKLPASLIETRPTVPAVSMLYLDLIEE